VVHISDAIAKVVLERYRSMTATERWLAASSLFETARDRSILAAEQFHFSWMCARFMNNDPPRGSVCCG
jgi:hypothetical protein